MMKSQEIAETAQCSHRIGGDRRLPSTCYNPSLPYHLGHDVRLSGKRHRRSLPHPTPHPCSKLRAPTAHITRQRHRAQDRNDWATTPSATTRAQANVALVRRCYGAVAAPQAPKRIAPTAPCVLHD